MIGKISLIFALLVLVSSCSTPGPMQNIWGPFNTPAFEPIVLATVKDGSERVRFKESTTMYENKEFRTYGVFFITDNGAYLATWDTRSYEYNLRYKLPISELLSMEDDVVERSMWFDSNLLVLQSEDGTEVGFSLVGKNAVRTILREIQAR